MSNVVASLSGGKDSMYALYLALQKGLDVNYLMFINNGSKAHRLNSWLLKLLSETTEIAIVTAGKDKSDIRSLLVKLGADTLISGVMTTSEHMKWYNDICSPIHVKHYAPLWGKQPLIALAEMRHLGFRILVIEVNTSLGPRKSWLGKEIDDNILKEIKELESGRGMDSIGELGEYHTLVLDCPIYRKKLEILESKTAWENSKGYVIIQNAILQSKMQRD